MVNFMLGVMSSLAAAGLVWVSTRLVWPYVTAKVLYKGVRIDGVWEIYDVKDGAQRKTGLLTLRQQGSRLAGTSQRIETRQGTASDRRSTYAGRIAGEQVTLLFQDQRGLDFDSGAYVFRVQNNCVEMVGVATFHGKPENAIVSERRVLKKTASPLPER